MSAIVRFPNRGEVVLGCVGARVCEEAIRVDGGMMRAGPSGGNGVVVIRRTKERKSGGIDAVCARKRGDRGCGTVDTSLAVAA